MVDDGPRTEMEHHTESFQERMVNDRARAGVCVLFCSSSIH